MIDSSVPRMLAALKDRSFLMKFTLVAFILICLETGALLVYLPWKESWGNNYFLIAVAEKLRWPGLINFVLSGYVRGAITGLGLVNIMLGIWEAKNFKKTIRALHAGWQLETIDTRAR